MGAGPGETYPDRLSDIIGRPVLNRGVPGETASQALARLERDVLGENPGVVLVCLGGNDLLRRHDPKGVFDALEEIVSRIQAQGAMVVLIGVEGLALVSHDFGKEYEELAERLGCVYVPDILGGIFGRSELMADRVHPNGRGYALFAEKIADKLQPHID